LSHAAQDLLVAERIKALGDEFNARTNKGQPLEYRLPAYKEIAGRLGVGAVISGLEAIVGYWDAGALTIASQTAVNAAIRNLLDPFVERIWAIEEPATNT
jgi:hypothetical protein